jgi:actin-related protein
LKFNKPKNNKKKMYGGDDVSAVVLDIGHTTSRCGHAGEEAPKIIIPSYVGIRNVEQTEGEMTVEA